MLRMMASPRADIRRLEERELFFLSQICRIRQARGLVQGEIERLRLH
jgi:hypothetical protein